MDNTNFSGKIAGSQPMKMITISARLFTLAALLFTGGNLSAALVGPAGYTNAFTTNQIAADWTGFSRTGGGGDNYNLDTDANANITAAAVVAPIVSDENNPPGGNAVG
ncbi:MAG TPA: hypothetical protein VK530_07965, partial [Candidatus Acidoferrum sp.]|nr:hypothetical protein [Candidatus Acidoferrum sp.]